MTGPQVLATAPATAVMKPPPTNRMPYSYHFVRLRADMSVLITMANYRSRKNQAPNVTANHTTTEASVVGSVCACPRASKKHTTAL